MELTKKQKIIGSMIAAICLAAAVAYWNAIKVKILSPAMADTHCRHGDVQCLAQPPAQTQLRAPAAAQMLHCNIDDQNCDTRTQASRTLAYRNLRDRHAERD